MTIPHGPNWLLFICLAALAFIVPVLAVYIRPSRHERSVRRKDRHFE